MAYLQDWFIELRSDLEVKRQKQILEELINEFILENISLGPELLLIPFTFPVPDSQRPLVTYDKWLIIQAK